MYMSIIFKNKKYQMKNIQLTNNMSIDILIDTYSEYFRDDENKSDRFIDVYHEN